MVLKYIALGVIGLSAAFGYRTTSILDIGPSRGTTVEYAIPANVTLEGRVESVNTIMAVPPDDESLPSPMGVTIKVGEYKFGDIQIDKSAVPTISLQYLYSLEFDSEEIRQLHRVQPGDYISAIVISQGALTGYPLEVPQIIDK